MTRAVPQAGIGRLMLGDEAVAHGAVDAGISAAYSYPGTPATEIFETIESLAEDAGITAHWTANEKSAFEAALGVSMMGRRALVSMKHVGLNVAADPFVNSALVDVSGGLVVAVADDPGMHSSQNEQDSRILADFARVPCLEPASQQEAYEMTREAFELSERFCVPVMVRLVTRLCHGRALVESHEPVGQRPLAKPERPADWVLLPSNSRRLWRRLLDTHQSLRAWSDASLHTVFQDSADPGGLGVITTGIARNSFLEHVAELERRPAHLHIGAYPIPERALSHLADRVERMLVIEEGYPFVERALRGVLPTRWDILGKLSGSLPLDGELTPDSVRTALGLGEHPRADLGDLALPSRPPQLCKGCPHGDSYEALNRALASFGESAVTSDIGCYTLGAMPPYRAIESCVCMGASIGMAKGASDAGLRPVVAVIGDSTFLHSGVTPLIDAVAHHSAITVLVLDNGTVAMTGRQPTVLAQSRLEPLIRGIGVDPGHLHVIEITPRRIDELAQLLRRELAHPGPSVVVAVRDCVEALKDRRREARPS